MVAGTGVSALPNGSPGRCPQALRPGLPIVAEACRPICASTQTASISIPWSVSALAVAVAEALQLSQIERPERLQEMNCLSDWIAEARRSMSPASRSVGFRTSGSTGRARFIVHELDALAQEIESLGSIFSDRARIVSVVPAHHIYGFLFTVLLPMHLGIDVIDARLCAPRTVRSIVEPGDLFVAFPAYWQALAASAWPRDIDGVTSGGPCSTELANAIASDGLRRLVEIYGATETGGIAWRDNANMAFRLLPHVARDGEQSVQKTLGGAVRRYALPDRVAWHGPDLLTPAFPLGRSRPGGRRQCLSGGRSRRSPCSPWRRRCRGAPDAARRGRAPQGIYRRKGRGGSKGAVAPRSRSLGRRTAATAGAASRLHIRNRRPGQFHGKEDRLADRIATRRRWPRAPLSCGRHNVRRSAAIVKGPQALQAAPGVQFTLDVPHTTEA